MGYADLSVHLYYFHVSPGVPVFGSQAGITPGCAGDGTAGPDLRRYGIKLLMNHVWSS